MPEDFTKDCLKSISIEIKDASTLRSRYCEQCRNSLCHWAEAPKTLFDERISTQEDRFISNPKIADESHPMYFKVREIDFPDLMREAIILEAADRKNDWEIPTIEESVSIVLGNSPEEALRTKQVDDAVRALAEARGTTPPEVPTPEKDIEREVGKLTEPEPIIPGVFTIAIPSRETKNKAYQVSISLKGEAIKCTCRASEFGKRCTHLKDAERLFQAGARPEAKEVRAPAPEMHGENAPRNSLFPNTHRLNTQTPKQGIMIGGDTSSSTPQTHDPWSPQGEEFIKVGSTLVIKK